MKPDNDSPQQGLLSTFAAGCLLIASISYLLKALGLVDIWPLTGIALLLYAVPGLHRLPIQVYFLMGFTSVALVSVIVGDGLAWSAIGEGVNRGAFLMFFLVAFALMGDVARSSPMIHRCGEVVVSQPPTRRYAVLTVAAHILSILVSLGTGNLFGTIIDRATNGKAAQNNPQLAKIRRRRMTTAVLRGLSTPALWSPTTLIVGILLAATPDLRLNDVVPTGLLVMLLMLFSGWLLDWLTRPRPSVVSASAHYAEFKDLISFLPLIGLIMMLLLGALLLEHLLPVRQITALILSVILVALSWLVVQHREQRHALKSAVGQLQGSWVNMLNRPRGEIVLVSLAGLLSVLVSLLLSAEDMGKFVAWTGLTEASTLILMSMLIIVLGNLGITPLVSIALAIESVWKIPGLDFNPALVFLCFTGTWSLYTMGSLASVTLRILTLAVGEKVPTVVGWNLVFCGFWLIMLYSVVYAFA
ncbi:MAG: hypothetical protein ACPG47_09575 [Leucothrix sp.]